MSPEGYRAPRRHYPTIRQDAYEGTIGLKGDYMRDGATRAQMNRAEAEYLMKVEMRMAKRRRKAKGRQLGNSTGVPSVPEYRSPEID